MAIIPSIKMTWSLFVAQWKFVQTVQMETAIKQMNYFSNLAHRWYFTDYRHSVYLMSRLGALRASLALVIVQSSQ